jgi:hypothetical protein
MIYGYNYRLQNVKIVSLGSMPSYRMLRRVAFDRADVWWEHSASIIRMKEWAS